jgi:UDP-N-acetylmuramoyl-L-alanyl-D-glutamate--2,6-diaminopimelate ligase
MTIEDILRGLKVKSVKGPLNKDVKGIAYDSRLIKNGYIFVAFKGFKTDGHSYIDDAIQRGCVGVVAEKTCDVKNDTPLIEVDDSRKALAFLSEEFYRRPSKELFLIGITGTNGKTTTSFITKSIFDAWNMRTGLLGTIHYEIGEERISASHTTPESLDLQRYLRKMVDRGVQYAVLEVSSHALTLHRVEGCLFQVAAFTNFSQDHLDFHGTMEEYFSVKNSLFDCLGDEGYAVLNSDDPWIRDLATTLRCNVITCGLEKGAMLRAVNIKEDKSGLKRRLSFDIEGPEGRYTVDSRLIGRNNVYNIILSAGIAYAAGVPREAVIKGIREAKAIEGRFEIIDEGQEFTCIVDYAHTEDALKNLIQEARRITPGRIITVFGCGGDRDRTKRPRMGAVAGEMSDTVVITSDNPRTEDPMEIIREIAGGIEGENHIIQPDRATAIKEAVLMAGKDDTILIAGKGHEDYQEITGILYPFSDREVFKEIVRKIRGAKGNDND